MSQRWALPAFATEADEALWHFEQQDEFADDLTRASEEGSLHRGPLTGAPMQVISLRLSPSDAQRAESLAVERGLSTPSLLEALLHDALERTRQP